MNHQWLTLTGGLVVTNCSTSVDMLSSLGMQGWGMDGCGVVVYGPHPAVLKDYS